MLSSDPLRETMRICVMGCVMMKTFILLLLTVLMSAVQAPHVGHAESARSIETTTPLTSPNPDARRPTAKPARTARPERKRGTAAAGPRRTKFAPRHRRDFGYQGFAGNSY